MTIRQHINHLRQRLANHIAPARTYEVVMNEGGVPLARVVSRSGPPVIASSDVYTVREVAAPRPSLRRRWRSWFGR